MSRRRASTLTPADLTKQQQDTLLATPPKALSVEERELRRRIQNQRAALESRTRKKEKIAKLSGIEVTLHALRAYTQALRQQLIDAGLTPVGPNSSLTRRFIEQQCRNPDEVTTLQGIIDEESYGMNDATSHAEESEISDLDSVNTNPDSVGHDAEPGFSLSSSYEVPYLSQTASTASTPSPDSPPAFATSAPSSASSSMGSSPNLSPNMSTRSLGGSRTASRVTSTPGLPQVRHSNMGESTTVLLTTPQPQSTPAAVQQPVLLPQMQMPPLQPQSQALATMTGSNDTQVRTQHQGALEMGSADESAHFQHRWPYYEHHYSQSIVSGQQHQVGVTYQHFQAQYQQPNQLGNTFGVGAWSTSFTSQNDPTTPACPLVSQRSLSSSSPTNLSIPAFTPSNIPHSNQQRATVQVVMEDAFVEGITDHSATSHDGRTIYEDRLHLVHLTSMASNTPALPSFPSTW